MTIRLWVYNRSARTVEFHIGGEPAICYAAPTNCAEGLGLIASVLRGNPDVTRLEIEQLTNLLVRFTPDGK